MYYTRVPYFRKPQLPAVKADGRYGLVLGGFLTDESSRPDQHVLARLEDCLAQSESEHADIASLFKAYREAFSSACLQKTRFWLLSAMDCLACMPHFTASASRLACLVSALCCSASLRFSIQALMDLSFLTSKAQLVTGSCTAYAVMSLPVSMPLRGLLMSGGGVVTVFDGSAIAPPGSVPALVGSYATLEPGLKSLRLYFDLLGRALFL